MKNILEKTYLLPERLAVKSGFCENSSEEKMEKCVAAVSLKRRYSDGDKVSYSFAWKKPVILEI